MLHKFLTKGQSPLYFQSDEVLIKQCIANDRGAQEYLYKKYFNILYLQCKRHCSDDEEIISVINDGMLKVFKNLHSYEHKGSFEGWIRKIIFHTLADFFRKENRRIKFLDVEEYNSSSNVFTDNDTLELEYLMNLVNALPETTKEVFLKFAIEGYSHIEIGEQLNMAEGTSKWHVNKARTMIKERIINDNNFVLKTAK